MSSLQIGAVVEGKTDIVIIDAILKAILETSFILTELKGDNPQYGQGWTSVLKWCDESEERFPEQPKPGQSLNDEPLLSNFDIIILHLDLDVAHCKYTDGGAVLAEKAKAKSWQALPCNAPCPPASDTALALEAALKSWINPVTLGKKTVLCLPAQSSGTWLAMAILNAQHKYLAEHECDLNCEKKLEYLPKGQKVSKTVVSYQREAHRITENWPQIVQRCNQALAFDTAIRAII